MTIMFTLPEPLFSSIPEPVPAANCLPDWWADTPVEATTEDGGVRKDRTVRGCMPFLNAMSMGWVIRVPYDLSIRSTGNDVRLEYSNPPDTIEPVTPFSTDQLPNTPGNLPDTVIPLKFNTYWILDGHPGSKAWVMPPRNRFQNSQLDNLYFTSGVYNINSTYIDSGIVAFLDLAEQLNLHITAGTPIAQVMLIDDEGFIDEASVVPMTDEMERDEAVATAQLDTNPHRYQEELWEPVGRVKQPSKDSRSKCPFGFGVDE